MALDLRVGVKEIIVGLVREITLKNSELASLRSELARYQKLEGVLDGQSRTAKTKANRKVRRKRVD